MIRRPPRSTPLYSSAASDVYKRQMLGLSAWELTALYRTSVLRVDHGQYGEAHTAIAALAVSSVVVSAFYAIRAAVFLTAGPESSFYVDWFGPRTTTFLILILLVVVSYTVTALSHFEIERGWRTRAVRRPHGNAAPVAVGVSV